MQSVEQQVGIFTVDASMQVSSWDDWMASATGVGPDVVLGVDLGALFPDLEGRGLLARFRRVLKEGTVEVLAPALHRYLIRCATRHASTRFGEMQQFVTIAPLRDEARVVGALVTVEDVTARLEREEELHAALSSDDAAERLAAAQALDSEDHRNCAPEPSLGALAGMLGDTDWRVRRAGAGALARHGGPTSVSALLTALREQHHSPSVLSSALYALASTGPDVMTPLIECLNAPDADLRLYAALVLGERGDQTAGAVLLQALDDPDPNVRYHVIEALGKLRSLEAVDALVAIAASRDFFLSFPALDSLARIGDPRAAPALVPLLADDLLRAPAAEALGVLGDATVVTPLVELLNTARAPVGPVAQALVTLHARYEAAYGEGAYLADLVREGTTAEGVRGLMAATERGTPAELPALVRVLGWLDEPGVAGALVRLLSQAAVRPEVVEALVRHGAPAASLLEAQLRSEDPDTRLAATAALGRIGDRAAVPALIECLGEEDDLAAAAAAALAHIGDARAFEPLLALLRHPQAAVRQAAIAALNSMGHPDLPARITVLLRDPEPLVRESAVHIAGYFGFPQCAEGLLACCQDADDRVRRAAVEYLPYLDDARAMDMLREALGDANPRVRASAARALAQADPVVAADQILAVLDDPDPWVRYFAAQSAGMHRLQAAIPALTQMAQPEESGAARLAAIEALGSIGAPSVVDVLVPLAYAPDDDVARAALAALGHTGLPEARLPLRDALRAPGSSRRSDAVRALALQRDVAAVAALQRTVAVDQDPRVWQRAVDALAEMRTAQAVAALIDLTVDPSRREACITALARQDEAHVPWVAEGLQHPREDVRRAVVEALGRMKHPRASERLRAALSDPEAPVRLTAVSVLTRIGSQGAERQLAAMAQTDVDARVRDAARVALGGGSP